MPRVDDELLKLATEITREAFMEIVVEIMRRNHGEALAMGLAVETFFAEAIFMTFKLHGLNPDVASFTRETLHKRVDELWNKLSPPPESPPPGTTIN